MDRLGAWLWRRHREHFTLAVAIVGMVVVTFGLGVLTLLMFLFVYGTSVLGSMWIWGGTGLAVNAVMIFAAWLLLRGARRPIDAWARGDERDPTATRDAALVFTTKLLWRTAWTAWVLHVTVSVPLTIHYTVGWGFAGAAGLYLGVTMVVATAFLSLSLMLHGLMRPLLAETFERTRAAPAPPTRSIRLRGRFRAAILLAVIAGAAGGGIAAQLADSDEVLLAAAIAGGVAILPFVALVLETGLIEPTLVPLRDLAEGIRRVRLGDLDHGVPVTSTDEFGDLATAFNTMQTGLAEREALHAAFGSYVDPALAQRLLESGSPLFEGEDLAVTVLFVDVRDFTSLSERLEPAAAVSLLNRLFDAVIPVLHEHGGHANHFLGDGLLAVFGAPNPLPAHADAAVAAAIGIQRAVRAALGSDLRLGIGINTGPVIAGTVGGGGRHEFTVIGDTVNVASRVEQLTKETGDPILITDATRRALSTPRPRSTRRGAFDLRGKSTAVTVHAVNPFPRSSR